MLKAAWLQRTAHLIWDRYRHIGTGPLNFRLYPESMSLGFARKLESSLCEPLIWTPLRGDVLHEQRSCRWYLLGAEYPELSKLKEEMRLKSYRGSCCKLLLNSRVGKLWMSPGLMEEPLKLRCPPSVSYNGRPQRKVLHLTQYQPTRIPTVLWACSAFNYQKLFADSYEALYMALQ